MPASAMSVAWILACRSEPWSAPPSCCWQIAGGQAGPLAVHRSEDALPARPAVALRRSQLARLLGLQPDAGVVTAKLTVLGMRVEATADSWRVTPPAHRFDIAIEADLIEEVGREIGLAAIPESAPRARQVFAPMPEAQASETQDTRSARGPRLSGGDSLRVRRSRAAAETFSVRGHRAACQSDRRKPGRDARVPVARTAAVDPAIIFVASRIASGCSSWAASSTAAATETEMYRGRQRRAAPRGAMGQRARQRRKLLRAFDFFDLRADVAALLSISGDLATFEFRPGGPACLHPGRSATILKAGVAVGSPG